MRIVIIGSGLIGVSTAYFLARHGHEVTVLDRRSGAGMETSFANSGMVTPSQADPWNSPASLARLFSLLIERDSPLLFKPSALFSLIGWALVFLRNSTPYRFRESLRKNAALANYSLEIFSQIREETGIFYDQIQNGTLKLYRNKKAFAKAKSISGSLTSMGVQLEVLDAKGVIRREPALDAGAASIVGGIYYPDDEAGDAHRFCRELMLQAEKEGAVFHFDAEVTRVESGNGRINVVSTSAGDFAADTYVLAAGPYSVFLAKQIGLTVPVRPIKGYSVTLDLNGWADGPKMPVIDDSRHISITPLGSRLRVAGMAEFAGMDASIRYDRVEKLIQFMDEIYPDFAGYRDIDNAGFWAGLRPYCCDGVPLIGQSNVENLYFNTGHGHLGWSLSAGSGKLLADYIHGQDTEIDISPYSPGRF